MWPNSPAQWKLILVACGVREKTADRWAADFFQHVTADKFNLGERELDDYLANMLHESGMLETLVENMNYSAERIMQVWPSRFKSLTDAQFYAHNPEALANKVYTGRFGNVNVGDGWKYRGQGLPQITFHDNFKLVGDAIGQDLVQFPELLQQPRYALPASIFYWEKKVPDSAIGDEARIRKIIQGGSLGVDHTRQIAGLARAALGGLSNV